MHALCSAVVGWALSGDLWRLIGPEQKDTSDKFVTPLECVRFRGSITQRREALNNQPVYILLQLTRRLEGMAAGRVKVQQAERQLIMFWRYYRFFPLRKFATERGMESNSCPTSSSGGNTSTQSFRLIRVGNCGGSALRKDWLRCCQRSVEISSLRARFLWEKHNIFHHWIRVSCGVFRLYSSISINHWQIPCKYNVVFDIQ